MRIRRLLVIACAGIALVVVLVLVVSAYWERKQTPFQNAPKLISALQAFSRDQAAAGRRLPPEVSMEDLLRGGYLTTNDVRAFEGMEVTFSTEADESHPQMILARARMPDGQFICALADGSVRGLAGRGSRNWPTLKGVLLRSAAEPANTPIVEQAREPQWPLRLSGGFWLKEV